MGTGATVGTGAGGVLLTTLFGATMLQDTPTHIEDLKLPVVPVNIDSALISEWLSESIESYSDEPLEGECGFFNFSKSHTSEFCDTFTISRMQSGTIAAATSRALKCAARAGTECVLSSEIGLAVPAAFLARQDSADGIKVLIAPRRVPRQKGDPPASQKHVRVSVPTDTFGSRTVVFNDTVRAEYLTTDKRVKSDVFTGDEAFCVSLLRVAFEKECWDKLDGQ
jgi:hypothetical protein